MLRRILMVAGEASGDAQGARLADALVRAEPDVRLYGVGGELMRAAGVDTVIDASELSLMGISEVAGELRHVLSCYRRLVDDLRSARPPDLVILIDFPDFNLRLARAAQKARVRVLYYVSPQVWAWRRGRVRKICRRVDRMIVLFPFEVDVYSAHGLDTRFVGHPLAEDVRATRSCEETRRTHGLPADRPVVALLPGSRTKTVANNLPVMLEAARLLGARASYALACAPGLDRRLVDSLVRDSEVDVAIVEGDAYNLLAASDAVAVTSGTATVECALLGCPMVVVYRMSRLSFAIARMLVKVPHIAMPNIILGSEVVPELVQSEATPENLADALASYLDSPERREDVSAKLMAIRDTLVVPGAADRAARLALEMMP